MKNKIVLTLAVIIGFIFLALYFKQPTLVTQPSGVDEIKKDIALSSTSSSAAISRSLNTIAPIHQAASSISTVNRESLRARLAISEDTGKIEFIKDATGLVIKELDQDPASISYKKPLSIYEYRNGQVTMVTRYQYQAGLRMANKLQVAYDSEGNIADYHESSLVEQF